MSVGECECMDELTCGSFEFEYSKTEINVCLVPKSWLSSVREDYNMRGMQMGKGRRRKGKVEHKLYIYV